MKVLVVSDSHGNEPNLRSALSREKECKLVFHLGDGVNDVERCKKDFPEKQFVCVRGNNDWNSQLDTHAYKFIEGNTVVATHGHCDRVNYSLVDLFDRAASVRANVALYGHTHRQDIQIDRSTGIYAINPGALINGQYAVVTMTKDGVDVSFKFI